MVNYRINEAETIFQAFYDSGESYADNEKYSVLSEYKVTVTEGTVGRAVPEWYAVCVRIDSQKNDGYAIKMERECDLDISEYDILRLFASVDKSIDLRIQAVIDGELVTVLECAGLDDTGEMDGKIAGKHLTYLSMEYRNNSDLSAGATLHWMGLSNSKKQAEMEARKSPYTKDSWAGCFVEGDVELKPMIGIYFDEEELKELRVRLTKEPFLTMTNQLRERAKKCMEVEPEQYITDYVPRHDRRFVRDRDMKRPVFQEDMDVLAFIGLLDENVEMLRMACRKMLSLAVTPFWTESIMGRLPGATWHHRSFTEDDTCTLSALVLDWAGSLLTWHGKNIVYDALMMKGLPRFESDFHSVNYIRFMNQGIVFNCARIITLMALANRYPRYEACLVDAAKDEREMIDNYIFEDGGTLEGPGYWNYTFSQAITGVYLLARHNKMSLEEYAWDRLKKTGTFALAMLSDYKDGTYTIPFNDAHTFQYAPIIYSGFERINKDPRWKKLYSRVMLSKESNVQASLSNVLLSLDMDKTDGEVHEDGLQTFNVIGQTSLRRTTEDVGRVHCFLSGGPAQYGHCHGDRGQILLEVDHIPMLIDRGVCDYSLPQEKTMGIPENHNLFLPEAPEGQEAFEQSNSRGGAKVLKSTYENGLFEYCTDLSVSWEKGTCSLATRQVKSPDAHIFFVYDDMVLYDELEASFRLNTRGAISQIGDTSWAIVKDDYQITVTPINYTVDRSVYGESGVDEHLDPVNMLKLYLAKAKEHHAVTLLEVSKVGQQKAKVLSATEIDYNGKIYTV